MAWLRHSGDLSKSARPTAPLPQLNVHLSRAGMSDQGLVAHTALPLCSQGTQHPGKLAAVTAEAQASCAPCKSRTAGSQVSDLHSGERVGKLRPAVSEGLASSPPRSTWPPHKG